MRALLPLALTGCSLIVDPPPAAEHPDVLVNSITGNDQQNPSVLFINGRYFIAWQDQSGAPPESDEGIRGRFVSQTGELQDTDVLINVAAAGKQNHPQVAQVGSDLFVVWLDESVAESDLQYRRISTDGTFVDTTNRQVVDPSAPTPPARDAQQVITLVDRSVFVVWSNGEATDAAVHDIRGRRFDSTGTPVGDDLVINTTLAGDQSEPQLARGLDNNILVVWTDTQGLDSEIRGQLLDPSGGSRIGPELTINTTITNVQTQPYVLATSDGGYIVAWTDASASGDDVDGTAVRGRVLGADGTGTTGDFVLNGRTEGDQAHPRLIQLPDLSIVLTYEDTSTVGPDRSDDGIRRRRFDKDLVPGDEDQINTFYEGQQEDSALASAPDGSLLVLWEDGGASPPDGSGDSIRLRLYAPGE